MGAKGLEHYLDNSATTAVSAAAADKAYQVMTRLYGNPSSLHSMGMDAERELTQARAAVAALIRCHYRRRKYGTVRSSAADRAGTGKLGTPADAFYRQYHIH